jgi:selenocysteine lyase/cysteine desulfurase
MGADTGLVAVPNCHWSTGAVVDLQKISDAAKSVGAFFILDLSQSLGVLPVSVEALAPDFAVSVGYKWLLGPYGLGYMYVSPRWHKEGLPLEYSWLVKSGSDDFARLSNYVAAYRPGARKFDMGEFPQINTMPMAMAGLQQVREWGPAFIQTQLKRLTNKIQDYKKSKGLFNEHALSAGHLTGIPIGNRDSALLAKKLQQQKIYISFRGTMIRVAPHLHNDETDIDALLACLQ